MGDYRTLRTEGRRVDKGSDWKEREKKGKRMVGVSGGVGWGMRGEGILTPPDEGSLPRELLQRAEKYTCFTQQVYFQNSSSSTKVRDAPFPAPSPAIAQVSCINKKVRPKRHCKISPASSRVRMCANDSNRGLGSS